MHHPWRAFQALREWTLKWSHDLPEDCQGTTCFDTKTVTMAHGLTQAERRATIAHETQHILRGPVAPYVQTREEQAVETAAAELLIPLEALAEALAWSMDEYEIADELWVDVEMVKARMAALTDEESRALNARLDYLELQMPVVD